MQATFFKKSDKDVIIKDFLHHLCKNNLQESMVKKPNAFNIPRCRPRQEPSRKYTKTFGKTDIV